MTARQKNILKDLERTQVPITANFLATKYKVSVRTIRNDIDCIDLYIKDSKAKFIRVPGLGMRIISANNLSDRIDKEYLLDEFSVLDSQKRKLLLILYFIIMPNPIKLDNLALRLNVSKGTVANEIKQASKYLQKYDIHLYGIRNRGFYIEYKKESLVKLNENFLKSLTGEKLYNTIYNQKNEFFDVEFKKIINECLEYMSNNLFLFITHYYTLSYLLALFVKISIKKNNNHKFDLYDDTLCKLAMFIEYKFDFVADDEDITILKYILNTCTDYAENETISDNNEELTKGIDAMIKYVASYYPEIVTESDTLRIDLLKHLKCSIDRNNLGIENNNPLLQEIKNFHYDEFKVITDSASEFNKYYPLILDENEISYITLYFRRALEKTQKIKEAKVMVVCNTGRGASKLLATRIMNNFPEIHIVSMRSYVDMEQDKNALDSVDLIISTLPLPQVNKPYVVVSPFLQESELTKIKEMIWLGDDSRDLMENNALNDLVESIVTQYDEYRDAEKFNKRVESILSSKHIWSNINSDDNSELYAKVTMEVFDLIAKLFTEGLSKYQFSLASGLVAHVIMSVPRWKRGKFIIATDYEDMKNKYPKEYNLVSETLKCIAQDLDTYIDDVESTAILRYIVY